MKLTESVNKNLKKLTCHSRVYESNVAIFTNKSIYNIFGVRASQIFKISEKFPNLQLLTLTNVKTEITDEHVTQLLLNVKSLHKLHLKVQPEPSKSFYRKDVGFKVCQTEGFISNLEELTLINCQVTDKLAMYLYLLDINVNLRNIWLQNCQSISNTSIFILLTSTDIRQSAYKKVQQIKRCQSAILVKKSYKSNSRSSRFQTVKMSTQCFSIAPKKLYEEIPINEMFKKEKENSTQQLIFDDQDFSCYIRDDIEDERESYKLEKLSILNCCQINAQIFYAIQYGSSRLRFVQTDLLLCTKWSHIIMQKNIAISMKKQGRQIKESSLMYLWEGDQYLDFLEVK
uniref:Uncharacterized protein n=1 Tax=Trepomonas sp. PC1 TaxID=1076344 RepID=A0A146K5N9_9EUKA|eukprot:JAP90809.1 Hypothetical protein TPC1_17783 [Trepomonas sp. PC1]